MIVRAPPYGRMTVDGLKRVLVVRDLDVAWMLMREERRVLLKRRRLSSNQTMHPATLRSQAWTLGSPPDERRIVPKNNDDN